MQYFPSMPQRQGKPGTVVPTGEGANGNHAGVAS